MGIFLLLLGWRVLSIYFIFTARKRSLGQGNIFTPVCHSVHGGRAWLWGVCMISGGCAWLPGGGSVWLLGGMHGCQGEGMHGCWGGMSGCLGGAWLLGGMCGCLGGHAWLQGCVVVGGMHRIRRDTVNERAVRILLECILVGANFDQIPSRWQKWLRFLNLEKCQIA